ncbi:MAG: COX15/CtaA family protein [Planctomycetes bacterium]|nr:COX15/CtaA family protein [Planctomycetota bacterium]
MTTATDSTERIPHASVASWLGVLFVMLFTLNTIGGWVRVSGSGIAIPQWPLINDSLLPPSDDAGWLAVHADWQRHQNALRERIGRGELSSGNLGRAPIDLADFRSMFLTEYSHRLLAALVGVAMAGCLTVVLRHRDLRRRIGVPMAIAGGLVVAQAVLGGFLINQGTNTHWLFLHQANAGLIIAAVLWSLLRLLDGNAPKRAPRRTALHLCTLAAVVFTWIQLLFGALVSGSKHSAAFIREFPTMMGGSFYPALWEPGRPLSWNLLDNAWLHQWMHRWFAWVLVAALIAAYALAARTPSGPRLRLALQVSATFIAIQIILGIANVLIGGSVIAVLLPLAHQFMGMCLFSSLVLALYDVRHEAMPIPSQSDVRFAQLVENHS